MQLHITCEIIHIIITLFEIIVTDKPEATLNECTDKKTNSRLLRLEMITWRMEEHDGLIGESYFTIVSSLYFPPFHNLPTSVIDTFASTS